MSSWDCCRHACGWLADLLHPWCSCTNAETSPCIWRVWHTLICRSLQWAFCEICSEILLRLEVQKHSKSLSLAAALWSDELYLCYLNYGHVKMSKTSKHNHISHCLFVLFVFCSFRSRQSPKLIYSGGQDHILRMDTCSFVAVISVLQQLFLARLTLDLFVSVTVIWSTWIMQYSVKEMPDSFLEALLQSETKWECS